MRQIVLIIIVFFTFSVNAQYKSKGVIHQKAFQLLKDGKYKKSYRLFKKANRNMETFYQPEIFYYQGICAYTRNGLKYSKRQKIIDLFSDYIEEKPGDAKGYLRRGMVYLDLFKPNLAINDFKKVMELDSLNVEVHFYYASALGVLSDTLKEEVVSEYSWFIDQADTSHNLLSYAYHNRGVARYELGDPQAREDFNMSGDDYLRIPLGVNLIGLNPIDTLGLTKMGKVEFSFQQTDNSKSDEIEFNTISIKKLKSCRKLSDIIETSHVESFRFQYIRRSEGFEPCYFIKITNQGDSFHKVIRNYISNASPKDIYIFQFDAYLKKGVTRTLLMEAFQN